jgi:hypothetical protein
MMIIIIMEFFLVMIQRNDVVGYNVSEGHDASIFRVKMIYSSP